jgi:hypothetical protein
MIDGCKPWAHANEHPGIGVGLTWTQALIRAPEMEPERAAATAGGFLCFGGCVATGCSCCCFEEDEEGASSCCCCCGFLERKRTIACAC